MDPKLNLGHVQVRIQDPFSQSSFIPFLFAYSKLYAKFWQDEYLCHIPFTSEVKSWSWVTPELPSATCQKNKTLQGKEKTRAMLAIVSNTHQRHHITQYVTPANATATCLQIEVEQNCVCKF